MTRHEILKTAIKQYGRDAQIDICIEEMSELTKALIKNRRCHGENLADVLEEIGDVRIMIDQMQMIFGHTGKYELQKIQRLEARLESARGGA